MYLASIESAKFLSLLEMATSAYRLVLNFRSTGKLMGSVSVNRVAYLYLDVFPKWIMQKGPGM